MNNNTQNPGNTQRHRRRSNNNNNNNINNNINNNNNNYNNRHGFDLGNRSSLLLNSSFTPAPPGTLSKYTSAFEQHSFPGSMTRIPTSTSPRLPLESTPTRYPYKSPSFSRSATLEITPYQQPLQQMNVDTSSPFSYFKQANTYNNVGGDNTSTTTHYDRHYSEYKAALLESAKKNSDRISQETAHCEQQPRRPHAIQQRLCSHHHRRHYRSSITTDSRRGTDDIISDDDRCRNSVLDRRPFPKRRRRSRSSLDRYISRNNRGTRRRAARGIWGPSYMATKNARRLRLLSASEMDEQRTHQMPRYSTRLVVRPPSSSSSIGLRNSYEYVDRLAALSVNKIPHCHEETRKVYDLQRMVTALLRERNGPFIGSLYEKAADYCSVPYAADRDGQNTVFESGLTPAEWLKAQRWTFFPTEDSLMVFTMQAPNKSSGGSEEGGSVPLTTSSSTSGVDVATSNEQPAIASSTSTTAETASTPTSSSTAPTASAATTTTPPSTTTTTRPLKKCIVVLPQSRHMTRSQTRQIQFNETQSTQYFSADEEVTQISAATAISSEGQHKVAGPPVLQEPLTTRDSHALRKEIKAREKKAKAEREAKQAAVREARGAAMSEMIQNEDDQLLAEKIQSQKERDRKRRDDRSDLMDEKVKPVEEEQTRKWIVEQLEMRRRQDDAEGGRPSSLAAYPSDQGEGSPPSVSEESASPASALTSVRVPALTRTTSYSAGRDATFSGGSPSGFESAAATTTVDTPSRSNFFTNPLPPYTQSTSQDPSSASPPGKTKEAQELEDFNRWADQNDAYYGNSLPQSRGRSPTVRHTLPNRPWFSLTRRSRSPTRRSRSPSSRYSRSPASYRSGSNASRHSPAEPDSSQAPSRHRSPTPPNNPTSSHEESSPPFKRRRAVIEKDEQQQQQQWKEEDKQQKDEDDDNAGEGSSSGRRRKTRRELQIERDEALARQLQATENPSRLLAQNGIGEETALRLQRSEGQRAERAERAAARGRRRGDPVEAEQQQQQQQMLNDKAADEQLQREEDDLAQQRDSITASVLSPLPSSPVSPSSAASAMPTTTYYSSDSAALQHQQQNSQLIASLSFSSLPSTRSASSSSSTATIAATGQPSTLLAELAVSQSAPSLSLPLPVLSSHQPYSGAIPISSLLSNSSGSTSPLYWLTSTSSSPPDRSPPAPSTCPARSPLHPYRNYPGPSSPFTGSGTGVLLPPSSASRSDQTSPNQSRSRSQSSSSPASHHTSQQPRRRYQSNLDMLADIASTASSSQSSSLSPAPPSVLSTGRQQSNDQGRWTHSAICGRGIAGETIPVMDRPAQSSGDDLSDDDLFASQLQVRPPVVYDTPSTRGSRSRPTLVPPHVFRRSQRIQGRNTTASVLDFLSRQGDKEDEEEKKDEGDEIKGEDREEIEIKEKKNEEEEDKAEEKLRKDKKGDEKAKKKQERERKKGERERQKEDEKHRKRVEREMKKAERENKKKEEKERKEEEKARKEEEKAKKKVEKAKETKKKKEAKSKIMKPKVVKPEAMKVTR